MSWYFSQSSNVTPSLACDDLTIGTTVNSVDNSCESKFLFPGVKKMANEVEELEFTMKLGSNDDGLIYADKNGFLKVYKHK